MKLLPRPVPGTLGLAGAVLAGWGLYHLMLIGSCSTPPSDGLPACPPGSEKYFFAVFGGMFVAIPATIAGGGAMTFLSLFAAIGIAGIRAGLSDQAGSSQRWLVWFGLIFLVTPVLPVLALPTAVRRQKKAADLVANGAEAIGTVLEMTDTGVTVNQNPRVRLRFQIEPLGGFPPPYEATKTATVSRLDIPRVGDRYPVWFDVNDPQRWAFASAITPEAAPGVRRLWDMAKRAAGPTVPAPAVPGPAAGDVVGELGRLNDLRLAGQISDHDFATRTAHLIQSLGRMPGAT